MPTNPSAIAETLEAQIMQAKLRCGPQRYVSHFTSFQLFRAPKGYPGKPFLIVLLLIVVFCASSRSVETKTNNLLVNGSFEDPVISSSFQVFSSIPGWTALPGRPDFEIQNGAYGDSFEGQQHCELDGFAPSAIFQDVTTTPSRVYELSFAFSARPEDR